jgi:hypothetical protein
MLHIIPHPRGPQKNHVLVVGDEGEVEELHHLFPVEVGVEGEVVLLDGLGPGESCGLHGGVDAALLLGRDLFLREMMEEGEIGAGALFRLLDHGIEDLGCLAELEPDNAIIKQIIVLKYKL